jgi:Na+-driven multidrug efflux pump
MWFSTYVFFVRGIGVFTPWAYILAKMLLLVFVDDSEYSLHSPRGYAGELLLFVTDHCESGKSKGKK